MRMLVEIPSATVPLRDLRLGDVFNVSDDYYMVIQDIPPERLKDTDCLPCLWLMRHGDSELYEVAWLPSDLQVYPHKESQLIIK